MGKEKNMGKRNHNFFIFILLVLPELYFLKADLTSEKKLLFFFNKIEVNGNVDVFLKRGTRLREAKIYADSEIINSVLTKVSQKTLFIDANNTYNIARRLPFIRLKAERKFPVEVIVSVHNIDEIRVLGQSNVTAENITSKNLTIFVASSGKVHLQNISTPKLNIIHEGEGDIILKGDSIEDLKVKITQNGSLFADKLEVSRATLIHQGNGTVHLNPSKWMDARIFGDGNLFLHEKPENIVIDQRGTGRVSDILPDASPLYDINQSDLPRGK
mgnify:FL=1|jgi:hypothetical protein